MVKNLASSNSNNKILNLWHVNPNENYINEEDRFLYVNLTAYPKNKSIIISEDNSNISTQNSINNQPISFIRTSNINGGEYVTTNYIEIDGNRSNSEGFGITSINIDIKSNFVPKVKVSFYDTRGNSFVNYSTNKDNNPLSVFFKMPYPIFKLTVKGFYGKSVSYCLHLIKWDCIFDNNKGGFNINAEFVGYTYSFLADIHLKYITSLSYDNSFKNKLNGVLPLNELFTRLGNLKYIRNNFENNDDVFNSLKNYNLIISQLKEIENLLGTLNNNDSDFYGNQLNFENVTQLNYTNIDNFIIFDSVKNTEFKNNIRKIDSIINEYNDNQINKGNLNYTINDILYKKINTYNNLTYEYTFNAFLDVLRDRNLNIDYSSLNYEDLFIPDPNSLFPIENKILYSVDFKNLKQDLHKILNIVLKQKNIYEKKSLEILNTQFEEEIGFKPTLKNIFEVICKNVDVFLEDIYNVSLYASNSNIQNRRSSIIGDNKKIYPFPRVINEQGEDMWLGELTNDKQLFPEIEYVNKIISNIVLTDNLNSEQTDNFSYTNYNHLPLTLIDKNDNIYNSNYFEEIGNRIFSLIIQNKLYNDNIYKYFVNLESLFFLEKYNDSKYYEYINSNNFIENTFNSIDIPIINNFNYSSGNSFFLKSINEDFYQEIISSNDKYFYEYQQYIDKNQLYNKINNTYKNYHFFYENNVNKFNMFLECYNLSLLNIIKNNYVKLTNNKYDVLKKYDINSKPNNVATNVGFYFGYIDNTSNEFDNINIDNIKLFLSSNFENLINQNIINDIQYFSKNINCVITIPYFFFLTDNVENLFNVNYREEILKVKEKYTSFEKEKIDETINYFLSLSNDSVKSFKSNLNKYNEFKQYHTTLLNFLNKTETIIFTNTLTATDSDVIVENKFNYEIQLKLYLKIFKEKYLKEYKNKQKSKKTKSNEKYNIINDNDIKLSTYNNFKSLYDKWISYGENNGKIYNACLNIKSTLFDHFHFVDRTWKDISDDIVINPNIILNLTKNNNITLYSFISQILNNSKFLLFFAPTFVSFKDEKSVEQMFMPSLYHDESDGYPSIIAMYIGGNSRNLDFNDENDGFNLNEQDIPKGFSERIINKNVLDENAYNVCSFEINITDNEQKHFTSVMVGQDEHRPTNESLKALSNIFDKGGVNKKMYKGADLYNMYINRSYTSIIESMGNMQIQPMNYYQLNVPFFNGAYLITEVQHEIVPHNHKTVFKGVRMPKVTFPLIKDVTTYINLDVNLNQDLLNYTLEYKNIEGSNGYDIIQTNQISQNATTDLSDNIIIDLYNGTQFKLIENLTETQFENNLVNTFNSLKKYGLKGDYCMSWVKNILADIGIVSDPYYNGNHAWTLFSNIKDVNNFVKIDDYNNQEQLLSNLNQASLSIVFGYFPKSKWINESINTIKNSVDINTISLVTNVENNITPITHVGIFYNGVFYDFVKNQVRQNVFNSFRPVLYYPIYNKIKNYF